MRCPPWKPVEMKGLRWTLGLGSAALALLAGAARADAPNRDPNVMSCPWAAVGWSPARGAGASSIARAVGPRRIAMGHRPGPQAVQAPSSSEDQGTESAGGR